jgi:hypothetical protein
MPKQKTNGLLLTHNLQQFDPNEPIKCDIALFGLGIFEGF